MKKKMKQEFTIQQGGQNYGFIENTNTLYNMCNVRHYGQCIWALIKQMVVPWIWICMGRWELGPHSPPNGFMQGLSHHPVLAMRNFLYWVVEELKKFFMGCCGPL